MLKLIPAERVIAWRLQTGRLISNDELIEALYANDPTCGPLSIKNNIFNVLISNIRNKIGIEIKTYWNKGWQVEPDNLESFRDLLALELEFYHKFNDPQSRSVRLGFINKRIKEESM